MAVCASLALSSFLKNVQENQELLAQGKLNPVWMVCVWSWLQAAVLGSSGQDAAWMGLQEGGDLCFTSGQVHHAGL